jgi:hypothetical protein
LEWDSKSYQRLEKSNWQGERLGDKSQALTTFGFFDQTGAWFSVYVWWAHNIPVIRDIEQNDLWLSPSVVLTAGAILTFSSLLFSPETKDLELSAVGES